MAKKTKASGDAADTASADMINHPPHYMGDGIEAIDVIEQYDLGYHFGSAVAYLLRAGRKGEARPDVEKARWYVQRGAARYDAGGRLPAAGSAIIIRKSPAEVVEAFGLDGEIATAVGELLDMALHGRPGQHLNAAVDALDAWLRGGTAQTVTPEAVA